MNKLAHAVAGCAVGAASAGNGGGCASGAIGAVIGELTAEAMGKRDDTVAVASLMAGLAAAVAGGDAAQVNLAASAGGNAAANNYLSHPERVALNNAQKACFADAASSACGTVTALQLKDQLSDKLLANATASCNGAECNDVSNFILKEMSAQGCTPPNACPDNALLSQYWRIAQEKAQGLEPVYPEGWLLDAKAALDLGKFGVSLLSSASTGAKGSLEALTQLAKTDVLSVAGANKGVGAIGSVADANFAQSTIRASEIFSEIGIKNYTQLAGRPINTIDDLVGALQSGAIKPSQLPVDYVVATDGTKLILNTRTSVALDRAGVPKSDWYGMNKTGVSVPDMPGKTFDDLAADQLRNNKLPATGTPTMPKGKN